MSRLEDMSTSFRNENVNKSTYTKNSEYNLTNKNALSDGDEKGKGELNGSIGSKTDIETRKKLLARSKYKSGANEYNQSNA
jgi:hypothetical protein